jgi:hypothetical protein
MLGPVARRRDRSLEGCDPTTSGTRLELIMIASSGFGLLALFSLLSILLGEDRRRNPDTTDLDTFIDERRWTR